MNLDPERLTAAISGAVGGAVYGSYHLATLWLSGQAATRRDYEKAVANIIFAVCLGLVMAYFLGLAVAAAIPWASLRDIHAVGFAIGGVGWELVPVALKVAKQLATKAGDR